VAAWRASLGYLFFLEPHETVFIFPTKANGTYSISSGDELDMVSV
jgi:hypothetical protein